MVKILIIDDKPDNLISMSALLKNLIVECKIITAESGREGINKAKKEQPDTILLDVIMPKMNGYETCNHLKEDDETKHIPIIMITALKKDSQSLVRGLDAGADSFLQKPIEASELKAQVQVALRIKKAEDIMRLNQRLLKDKVKEKETIFEKLIEQSNDAIYLLYKNKFEIINTKFYNLFGYNLEECQHRDFNFIQLVAPKSLELIENRKKLANKGKELKAIYEFTAIDKNGNEIECEVNVTYINYKNGIAVLGIIRDIRERIRMQKEKQILQEQLIQAQKMEAIGTLAGGIAHDFNNLLGVIIGYTELSLNIALNEKQKKMLKNVMQASERAKEMVKQILTFSHKNNEIMGPVNVGKIIKETIRFLRGSIPSSIEIITKIDKDIGLIYGNATQLNQILMNLSTNAVYAMDDKGKLTIELKEFKVDERNSKLLALSQGKYLLLSVNDTGIGMDKNMINRIFEPFFTTKESGEGTGLGLSVVYGIVDNHKGRIKVYSELNKGTTFNVFFPVLENINIDNLSLKQRRIPFGKNEQILFVDDELALAELGKDMLTELKYKVESRTSSVEALEVFKANPNKFDLIITDMTMPNLTGIQLVAQIHKLKPNIPIILCTGFSSIINKNNFKTYGIDALIMKPIIKNDLAETIYNILNNKIIEH